MPPKKKNARRECMRCDSLNNDFMIECETCLSWTHYECAELSKDQVDNIAAINYTCSLCEIDTGKEEKKGTRIRRDVSNISTYESFVSGMNNETFGMSTQNFTESMENYVPKSPNNSKNYFSKSNTKKIKTILKNKSLFELDSDNSIFNVNTNACQIKNKKILQTRSAALRKMENAIVEGNSIILATENSKMKPADEKTDKNMTAWGKKTWSASSIQMKNTLVEMNGSILINENAEMEPADEEPNECGIARGLQSSFATPIQMDNTIVEVNGSICINENAESKPANEKTDECMIARSRQTWSATPIKMKNTLLEEKGSIVINENDEMKPESEKTDECIIARGLQNWSATPTQMDNTIVEVNGSFLINENVEAKPVDGKISERVTVPGPQTWSATTIWMDNTMVEVNGSIGINENAEMKPAERETDKYMMAWSLQTQSFTPKQNENIMIEGNGSTLINKNSEMKPADKEINGMDGAADSEGIHSDGVPAWIGRLGNGNGSMFPSIVVRSEGNQQSPTLLGNNEKCEDSCSAWGTTSNASTNSFYEKDGEDNLEREKKKTQQKTKKTLIEENHEFTENNEKLLLELECQKNTSLILHDEIADLKGEKENHVHGSMFPSIVVRSEGNQQSPTLLGNNEKCENNCSIRGTTSMSNDKFREETQTIMKANDEPDKECCIVCNRPYRKQRMVEYSRSTCTKSIHYECDGIQEDLNSVAYVCPNCREQEMELSQTANKEKIHNTGAGVNACPRNDEKNIANSQRIELETKTNMQVTKTIKNRKNKKSENIDDKYDTAKETESCEILIKTSGDESTLQLSGFNEQNISDSNIEANDSTVIENYTQQINDNMEQNGMSGEGFPANDGVSGDGVSARNWICVDGAADSNGIRSDVVSAGNGRLEDVDGSMFPSIVVRSEGNQQSPTLLGNNEKCKDSCSTRDESTLQLSGFNEQNLSDSNIEANDSTVIENLTQQINNIMGQNAQTPINDQKTELDSTCWQYEEKGTCRYANLCKYKHKPKSSTNPTNTSKNKEHIETQNEQICENINQESNNPPDSRPTDQEDEKSPLSPTTESPNKSHETNGGKYPQSIVQAEIHHRDDNIGPSQHEATPPKIQENKKECVQNDIENYMVVNENHQTTILFLQNNLKSECDRREGMGAAIDGAGDDNKTATMETYMQLSKLLTEEIYGSAVNKSIEIIFEDIYDTMIEAYCEVKYDEKINNMENNSQPQKESHTNNINNCEVDEKIKTSSAKDDHTNQNKQKYEDVRQAIDINDPTMSKKHENRSCEIQPTGSYQNQQHETTYTGTKSKIKEKNKNEKPMNKKQLTYEYENLKKQYEQIQEELEYQKENNKLAHERIKEVMKEKEKAVKMLNDISNNDENEVKKQLAAALNEIDKIKKENNANIQINIETKKKNAEKQLEIRKLKEAYNKVNNKVVELLKDQQKDTEIKHKTDALQKLIMENNKAMEQQNKEARMEIEKMKKIKEEANQNTRIEANESKKQMPKVICEENIMIENCKLKEKIMSLEKELKEIAREYREKFMSKIENQKSGINKEKHNSKNCPQNENRNYEKYENKYDNYETHRKNNHYNVDNNISVEKQTSMGENCTISNKQLKMQAKTQAQNDKRAENRNQLMHENQGTEHDKHKYNVVNKEKPHNEKGIQTNMNCKTTWHMRDDPSQSEMKDSQRSKSEKNSQPMTAISGQKIAMIQSPEANMEKIEKEVCEDLVKNGDCSSGVKCKFNHTIGTEAETKRCEDLIKKGKCIRGTRCKYSHNIDISKVNIGSLKLKIKNNEGELLSAINNQKYQQVKANKTNQDHKKTYQKNTKNVMSTRSKGGENIRPNEKQPNKATRINYEASQIRNMSKSRNGNRDTNPHLVHQRKRLQERIGMESLPTEEWDLKRGSCHNGIYCSHQTNQEVTESKIINNATHRKIKKPCWYQQNGICKKGEKCNYNHKVCKYYKQKRCKYAEECWNIHIPKIGRNETQNAENLQEHLYHNRNYPEYKDKHQSDCNNNTNIQNHQNERINEHDNQYYQEKYNSNTINYSPENAWKSTRNRSL